MNRAPARPRHPGIARWCALLLSSGAFGQSVPSAAPELRANAPVDVNRPYAQELRSSAAPDLVITVAGSLAINTSADTLSPWDPRLVGILNGKAFPGTSSVAISDLQTTFLEPRTFSGFPYAWEPARAYAAPPGMARRLQELGLSMVSVANGHALDWGIDGMRATAVALDQAGLKHAGTGEREALARMACFLDEPRGKGRIALLAAGTRFRPTTNALSPHGAAPGRPGISAVELTPVRLVPQPQLAELKRIACRFQYPGPAEHCDRTAPAPATVDLFGSRFEAGATTDDDYLSREQLNLAQVANELRAVREAKQNSDLAVLTIATGQLDRAGPSDPRPSDALVRLAHAAIEAGADLVEATGQPALGPVEIYRPADGPPRPILYGVGFLYRSPEAMAAPDSPAPRDGLIVRSRIDSSTVSLELYPVELEAASAAAGMPRLADPERGRAILEQLAKLSAPFHTTITIENYGDTLRGVVHGPDSPGTAAGRDR